MAKNYRNYQSQTYPISTARVNRGEFHLPRQQEPDQQEEQARQAAQPLVMGRTLKEMKEMLAINKEINASIRRREGVCLQIIFKANFLKIGKYLNDLFHYSESL